MCTDFWPEGETNLEIDSDGWILSIYINIGLRKLGCYGTHEMNKNCGLLQTMKEMSFDSSNQMRV